MASSNKSSILSNYECDGQIDLFEYLEQLNRIYPVDIRGLCDDAVCPICGYEFMDPKENDLPACPICNCKVDWARWHKINDPEEDENA